MTYSIYGRTHAECAALAMERGWKPGEWFGYLLDIDEPYARLRGVDAPA